MTNIFAYTAPGLAPEYISINLNDNGVTLTAMAAGDALGNCGPTVDVKLSHEQLVKLANTLFSFACTNKA